MSENSATIDGKSARPGFMKADQVSSTRALILYAVGALIGLIIGGIGLFNARGTQTNVVPPEDMAVINQVPVLRSDFVAQLESETGLTFDQTTREQKLAVLNEMVREELLVQRALELNFSETDQPSRDALVISVENQAIAEATTSQPTEADLQKQYNDNIKQYETQGEMTVDNLLLPKSEGRSDSEAQAIAAQAVADLRNNVNVDDVIEKYGLTRIKTYDADFYFAAKIHLGDKIYNTILDYKDGTVAEPIPQDDGYHVVRMVKNTPPKPLTYAEARPQVLTDYKTAQQTRLMNNTINFLRNRSKILIADDYSDYNPDKLDGGAAK
jgi:hypothetical protein